LIARVPVIWEESDEPFVCGAVFRVGRSDETVVTGGITHLVEHLVLPTAWPVDVDFNGTVESTFTQFWFAGEKTASLRMLGALAHDLVDPPLGRLEREKSILRAEASWRGHAGSAAHAAFLRFGTVGHGLTTLEEYGLHWLGRREVRRWIDRGFCAANAVVYMTGRPPRGFGFELPRGRSLPLARLAPIPGLTLPAVYTYGRDGNVSLSLLGPRSYAVRMLTEIAGRRIRDLLRYRLGISYSTAAIYEQLDRRTAHVLLSADALDRDVTAARTGLIHVLDDLAARGPTEEELAHERETARREIEHPHTLPSKLVADARAMLDRTGVTSPEELLAGLATTSATDVRRAAAAAMRTALLVLPVDAEVPGGRFSAYPLSSVSRVAGRRFSRVRADDPPERLEVSDEGVTLFQEDGFRTVVFAECAARIRYRDGVGLWSRDGFYLWIDPAEWKRGTAALKAIDAADIAPDRHVDLRTSTPAFDDADLVAGNLAHRDRRWDDAARQLGSGLDRSPGEPGAWSLLAFALGKLEKPGAAADAALRATELDPNDDWAPRYAAISLGRCNRRTKAAELALEALRRNPTSIVNMAAATEMLVSDWRIEDALKVADRALELFPGAGQAWFAVGWSALAAGRVEPGLEALGRAVELEPESAHLARQSRIRPLDGRASRPCVDLHRTRARVGPRERQRREEQIARAQAPEARLRRRDAGGTGEAEGQEARLRACRDREPRCRRATRARAARAPARSSGGSTRRAACRPAPPRLGRARAPGADRAGPRRPGGSAAVDRRSGRARPRRHGGDLRTRMDGDADGRAGRGGRGRAPPREGASGHGAGTPRAGVRAPRNRAVGRSTRNGRAGGDARAARGRCSRDGRDRARRPRPKGGGPRRARRRPASRDRRQRGRPPPRAPARGVLAVVPSDVVDGPLRR
jgi:tetratricopeptide (TPR) repeat protein